MKRKNPPPFACLFLCYLYAFCCNPVSAQEDAPPITPEPLLEVKGQWFLGFQHFVKENHTESEFTLKRGYVTFQKKLSSLFTVRFTQDITLDNEGSDAGNVEMRLKYLYLDIHPEGMFLGSAWHVEAGMVHRPWLSFEDGIYQYRMQGTLPVERHRVMNSADFGVTFSALLGGPINQNYQQKVSSNHPGKFGSLALGIYNGGGYHDLENNASKNFEGRITLRPFPGRLPGLQLSYHIAAGKGNIAEEPGFFMQQGYLSFESPRFLAAVQYFKGTGNSYGSFIDTEYRPFGMSGFSVFSEGYLYGKSLSLVSRYDHFELEPAGNLRRQIFLTGLSYHFLGRQKVMADLEWIKENGTLRRMIELVLELRF
ncbi:MAG: hypothetical protein ACP5D1_04625 [Bacteroidales bacterium]